MAGRSRAQFDKRRKELARQERQKEKRAKRLENKERVPGEGENEGIVEEEEDPDLAGIQLGPQPPPDEPPAE